MTTFQPRLLLVCVLACVVLLARVSQVVGQASGNECSGTVGSSKYDLSALKQATGSADVSAQDSGGNTFIYRPCQVVSQTGCATGTTPNPAVCQKTNQKIPQFHDCGSTTQASWAPRSAGEATGFILTFNGGEEDRRVDIEFICTPGGPTGQLAAANPSEQPTHFYHLTWSSGLACPGAHGDGGDGGGGDGDGDDGPAISGGWIFIIVLVSLVFIYFVAGVAYNKFRKDAHGIELIPNHEFWFALPGLVWAGNLYTYRKLRGLCGASYDTV